MIVITTDLLINTLSQYHLTVILEYFVQLFHYCDWYKYYNIGLSYPSALYGGGINYESKAI